MILDSCFLVNKNEETLLGAKGTKMQLWVPLIEKAIAQYRNSYADEQWTDVPLEQWFSLLTGRRSHIFRAVDRIFFPFSIRLIIWQAKMCLFKWAHFFRPSKCK